VRELAQRQRAAGLVGAFSPAQPPRRADRRCRAAAHLFLNNLIDVDWNFHEFLNDPLHLYDLWDLNDSVDGNFHEPLNYPLDFHNFGYLQELFE
jgi:hypothetical protein